MIDSYDRNGAPRWPVANVALVNTRTGIALNAAVGGTRRSPWSCANAERAGRWPKPLSSPRDSSPRDSSPRDSSPRDSSPRDSSPRDSSPYDSGPPDPPRRQAVRAPRRRDELPQPAVHPARRGTLLVPVVACLLLGVGLLNAEKWLGPVSAAVLGGAALAGLLVVFAVYWVGWLMHGHALWLREQRGRSHEAEA